MKFVISSGHSKYVRGAKGYLDEVDEARRVVDKVASYLRDMKEVVVTFHDDVSKTQSENLNRIVNYHNSQSRDYDVSVHFNAYQTTDKAMGVECLYYSQATLATKISQKIAAAGPFTNRGAKKRTDLFFLKSVAKPAVLIEVCFVDSRTDSNVYKANFDPICVGIAEALAGRQMDQPVLPEPEPPSTDIPTLELTVTGTVRIIINGEEYGATQEVQSEPDPME